VLDGQHWLEALPSAFPAARPSAIVAAVRRKLRPPTPCVGCLLGALPTHPSDRRRALQRLSIPLFGPAADPQRTRSSPFRAASATLCLARPPARVPRARSAAHRYVR